MQQQLPFVRLSLRDASGSTAGINAWLQSGTTAPAGASAAAALTGAAGALSGATVEAYHVVYRGVEEPRPEAPGANPVAGAGVFVFSSATPDQYAVVVLPAVRSDLLLTSGPGAGILIDDTNAAVIAFADAMTSGFYCNPFGYGLIGLETAFIQWRP